MFRLRSEDMFGDESDAGGVTNGELLSMETVFQTCVLLPETEEIKKQSRISDDRKGMKSSKGDRRLGLVGELPWETEL